MSPCLIRFQCPQHQVSTGTPCKASGIQAPPSHPANWIGAGHYHCWPRPPGSIVVFIKDILFCLLLAKVFFTFLLPHNEGLPLALNGLTPTSLEAARERQPQAQCYCHCLGFLQQRPSLVPGSSSSLLLTKVAEMANSHFILLTDWGQKCRQWP